MSGIASTIDGIPVVAVVAVVDGGIGGVVVGRSERNQWLLCGDDAKIVDGAERTEIKKSFQSGETNSVARRYSTLTVAAVRDGRQIATSILVSVVVHVVVHVVAHVVVHVGIIGVAVCVIHCYAGPGTDDGCNGDNNSGTGRNNDVIAVTRDLVVEYERQTEGKLARIFRRRTGITRW